MSHYGQLLPHISMHLVHVAHMPARFTHATPVGAGVATSFTFKTGKSSSLLDDDKGFGDSDDSVLETCVRLSMWGGDGGGDAFSPLFSDAQVLELCC